MIFMGFGPWKYQLSKMGITESPSCRFCGLAHETTIHLFTECPGLENIRVNVLNIDHETVLEAPVATMAAKWDVQVYLEFTKSMVSSGHFRSQEKLGIMPSGAMAVAPFRL